MAQPEQKPGRSKQNYGTPLNFLAATKRRLGIPGFVFDFAADAENAKAPRHWNEQDDSLSRPPSEWAAQITGGWGWLNPPFSEIGPWAQRCAQVADMGEKVAFLVPAGVGANWYRDYVHGRAFVLALNGRLAFMPDKPNWLYPKDCILCLYGLPPGFNVWNWREKSKAEAA